MKLRAAVFILAVMLIVLVSACTQPETKPREEIYELYDSDLKTGEENITDLEIPIEESEIPAPFTGIEFQLNELVFSDGTTVYHIPYWRSAPLRTGDSFVINEKEFFIETKDLETANPRFIILADNPTQDIEEYFTNPTISVASKGFTYNQTSTESISFDTRLPVDDAANAQKIEYAYYVSKPLAITEPTLIIPEGDNPEDDTLFSEERVNFFLKAQEFNVQFGKKVRFVGTDAMESGQAERPYYFPDYERYGENETDDKYLVGHFEIDEQGDGVYDIQIYLDTFTDKLIKLPNSHISNYTVTVKAGNQSMSTNSDQKIKTSYGSLIEVNDGMIKVKIPKK